MTHEPSEEKLDELAAWFHSYDRELLAFITGVGEEGEAPVTLNVAGAFIGGWLISESRWLSEYLGHVSEYMTGAGSEEFKERIQNRRLEVRAAHVAGEERWWEAHGVLSDFIHLKGASLNGEPLMFRGLWRGRLDRVDGWSPGFTS